jgi:hypothetical protein
VSKPRILIVTPEITYLPDGMGNMAQRMHAKAGGLADVSASLVSALFQLGADVHVALPNYRQMFNTDVFEIVAQELETMRRALPEERIHLAEDRIFYYRDSVYSSYGGENPRIALAFQREVLNNIIPRVRPDLIHCNDWMTGLIPAAARRFRIPCLFTVHNIHTEKMTLEGIEGSGIDAAQFWNQLYYSTNPHNYETARPRAPVDLLASGIFAAHYINTVSPSFLNEVADGQHHFVPDAVRWEIKNKRDAGCAVGILNAPDESYNPATDRALHARPHRSPDLWTLVFGLLQAQYKDGTRAVPGNPIIPIRPIGAICYRNATSVRQGSLLHDGQTDADAGRFAAEFVADAVEGIKNPDTFSFRHAGTLIAYGEDGFTGGFRQGQVDGAAGRGEFQRIVQKIEHRLTDCGGIDFAFERNVRKGGGENHVAFFH